jgi:hypothetical protein
MGKVDFKKNVNLKRVSYYHFSLCGWLCSVVGLCVFLPLVEGHGAYICLVIILQRFVQNLT